MARGLNMKAVALAMVVAAMAPMLSMGLLTGPFARTGLGQHVGAGRSLPSLSSYGNFSHYTFDQVVDHFDPLNTATYKQRYAVDSSAWSPGNPIFIFLSGEAPMEFFEFQEVSAVNWAHHFGAMYISLEHRYYGESNPVPNYTTANYKYLSSRQALADAANFITTFNATLEKAGDWVVFGCSYSGALSAWFRAKYPNLVVASVAPSGPVEAQSNFTTFLGQFSNSAAPSCVDAVKTAVAAISDKLTSTAGRQYLQKTFNTCNPLEKSNDFHFLTQLAETVGSSDQMNNPPTWILNTTCNMLTAKGDIIENFANAYNFNFGQADVATCNNFQASAYVKALQSTEVGPANADRSWWFQKCTEFGFFKPTYNNTSAFWYPLPVDKFVSYCTSVFGVPNFAPDTEATNAYYGGYNLQGSNILFTNGLLDPWHLLSITEDQTPTQKTSVQAVTYEAGHCAPMTAATDVDPPSLTAARQRVEAFLATALNMAPRHTGPLRRAYAGI